MLGESVAAGGVVPVKVTVCLELGTPLLSSVNVSVAVRIPIALGLNFTLHEQVPPDAATVELSVHGVPLPGTVVKSLLLAPLIVTVAKCSAVVPALVSVPFCAVLGVSTACGANVTVVGAN